MLRCTVTLLVTALLLSTSVCAWAWVHAEDLGIVRSRPVKSKDSLRAPGARAPLVIFDEGAGFGPVWRVVVYDDGNVVDDRSERIPPRIEGTIGRDEALALARRVTVAIERPERRREQRAEDGPVATVAARIGDTWTEDTAHGMFHGGVYTHFFPGWRFLRFSIFRGQGMSEHPWSRFFDAITEVTTLPLRDVHAAPLEDPAPPGR